MRIAQIAPIVERIPPKKYGGTERVIYHLTEELVKRGHEVTLFASGDTVTSARLVSVVPKPLREMPEERDIYGFNAYSLMNMGLAYAMQDQFDIIHDHNAHMGLPTANISRTPVVMTWHGPYDERMRKYFTLLRKPHLVSISRSQARLAPGLEFASTVYNGLDMSAYPFSERAGDHLLYIGRIDQEKGLHHAIDTALRLGKKLIVAAKLDDQVASIKSYFDQEIAPRFKKHPRLVKWVGEVDEAARNELMKDALCLLHPVTWPEPFGLTMIEAMACGCPVVAFNLGSIPEVVQHGLTGFVVENVEQMVAAVKQIKSISRATCRAYALGTFSATRMADGYEEVFERVVATQYTPPEMRRGNARVPNGKERSRIQLY